MIKILAHSNKTFVFNNFNYTKLQKFEIKMHLSKLRNKQSVIYIIYIKNITYYILYVIYYILYIILYYIYIYNTVK